MNLSTPTTRFGGLPEKSKNSEANQEVNNMSKPSSSHHSRGCCSSPLDLQVTGTTTLALIGEDVIYVVTDQRSTYKPAPFMIADESCSKTFVISSNVLATWAGNPRICSDMCIDVKSRVNQDIIAGKLQSGNVVRAAATHARKWITKWEDQHPNMTFLCQIMIIGWADGKRVVFDLQSPKFHQLRVKYDHGDGFTHGSGAKYVKAYYQIEDPMPYKQSLPLPQRSNNELAEIGKRAVVYSALHVRSTGGRVGLVEVGQTMIHESDPEEILEVLHDDYDKFKTCLSCFLFCLYRMSDFEYASDTEALLAQEIYNRFTPKILSSHVIQIKEKYFIRILQFENEKFAKEEYQAINLEWKQQRGYGHTQDVDVHPDIRALPWIELHRLQGTPFVFAMPAKKYISLFLDL